MALTKDRATPRRDGHPSPFPVAADTVIFGGSLVALEGGYLVPAKTATGLVAVGRAEQHVDNRDGAPGALTCEVMPGVYPWDNSLGDDLITQAEVGSTVYMVDDHTVAKTHGTNTRSAAGVLLGIDSEGVWVATVGW